MITFNIVFTGHIHASDSEVSGEYYDFVVLPRGVTFQPIRYLDFITFIHELITSCSKEFDIIFQQLLSNDLAV